MAFQFVPNADGSFTEGDKQTNPETNQEYIFTDGAWRALGIEVATDLTELDNRDAIKDWRIFLTALMMF